MTNAGLTSIQILSLICSCFVTLEVHYGVGRHIYYLTPGKIEQTGKMVWMTEPFSTMSACFGKISIAFQLLRIINKQNRWQAHILWFMIGSLFLVNVVCLIITFAQCTPVYALWDRTVGTCWSPLIQLDSGYMQGGRSLCLGFQSNTAINRMFSIFCIHRSFLDTIPDRCHLESAGQAQGQGRPGSVIRHGLGVSQQFPNQQEFCARLMFIQSYRGCCHQNCASRGAFGP